MEGNCCWCSEIASDRYTVVSDRPEILEGELICDECLAALQQMEQIEIYEEPVLMRGGKSLSPEQDRSHTASEADELLKTLSHTVRREVIHYFETHSEEPTTSLEDLVVHLQHRLPSKTSDTLWKTLYQVHLPTLQSKGWLEFDTDRELITYRGHGDAERIVREILDMFSP